jgi:retinol dehydrogenase-12
VLVGRDRGRGEAAVAAVKGRSGSRAVALKRCDFTSLTQIRALAADVVASHPKLHVLVNNRQLPPSRRRRDQHLVPRALVIPGLCSR